MGFMVFIMQTLAQRELVIIAGGSASELNLLSFLVNNTGLDFYF